MRPFPPLSSSSFCTYHRDHPGKILVVLLQRFSSHILDRYPSMYKNYILDIYEFSFFLYFFRKITSFSNLFNLSMKFSNTTIFFYVIYTLLNSISQEFLCRLIILGAHLNPVDGWRNIAYFDLKI